MTAIKNPLEIFGFKPEDHPDGRYVIYGRCRIHPDLLASNRQFYRIPATMAAEEIASKILVETEDEEEVARLFMAAPVNTEQSLKIGMRHDPDIVILMSSGAPLEFCEDRFLSIGVLVVLIDDGEG